MQYYTVNIIQNQCFNITGNSFQPQLNDEVHLNCGLETKWRMVNREVTDQFDRVTSKIYLYLTI